MSRPGDDHDSGWKEMARKFFRPFLEYFFPRVAGQIDWEREFEFLDKELKQAVRLGGKGGRAVDILAKVWLKNGARAAVLAHVEILSQVDRTLPKRIYLYRALLEAREGLEAGTLCILADPDFSWRPDRYEKEVFCNELTLKSPVVKLLDYRERWEELRRNPNPFAMVVMAHLKSLETKRSPKRRLRLKTDLMIMMHGRVYSDEEIGYLARFLDLAMPLPVPLQNEYLIEAVKCEEGRAMPVITQTERLSIEKGMKQGIEQGIEQGMARGIEKATREMVLDALQGRFPDAPTALRARVAELPDVGALRSLHSAIMTASSVQDIEQRLPAPT